MKRHKIVWIYLTNLFNDFLEWLRVSVLVSHKSSNNSIERYTYYHREHRLRIERTPCDFSYSKSHIKNALQFENFEIILNMKMGCTHYYTHVAAHE